MRGESDVQSAVDFLQCNWINLFHEDPTDLMNISLGYHQPQTYVTTF